MHMHMQRLPLRMVHAGVACLYRDMHHTTMAGERRCTGCHGSDVDSQLLLSVLAVGLSRSNDQADMHVLFFLTCMC